MSVLIKDMEKPKSCYAIIDGESEYCPFVNTDDDCVLLLKKGTCEGTWEEQYSKCPLVEIPEPCEDAVPRTSVEYICRKNTVSTNPYEHKYHDKFIQFMDDPEISDFGRWQHSNGFNTALVAVKCDLDKVPSVTLKQQWVPCSERLPENGRQVLVFARSVHFALAKYDEMREADGTYKKQWVTFDAWKPFYTIKEVVAWMPLSEPYKEER